MCHTVLLLRQYVSFHMYKLLVKLLYHFVANCQTERLTDNVCSDLCLHEQYMCSGYEGLSRARDVNRVRNVLLLLLSPFFLLGFSAYCACTSQCGVISFRITIIHPFCAKEKWNQGELLFHPFHCRLSLLKLNIKFPKTWNVPSNNVNTTIRKHSSRAFIWVVTPLGFDGQFRTCLRSFLGLSKFAFGSERVKRPQICVQPPYKLLNFNLDYAKTKFGPEGGRSIIVRLQCAWLHWMLATTGS